MGRSCPKSSWMNSLRLLPVILLLSGGAPVFAANWQVVKSPNLGSDANSLSSVAAVADNDIWAVGWGRDQTSSAYRTVIEHWNGRVGPW